MNVNNKCYEVDKHDKCSLNVTLNLAKFKFVIMAKTMRMEHVDSTEGLLRHNNNNIVISGGNRVTAFFCRLLCRVPGNI